MAISQILHHGVIRFAEVKFYFTNRFQGETRGFAFVSLYSPANEHLLDYSTGTLVVCRYAGEGSLVVIDANSICSVVAMVPFQYAIDGGGDYYFMIEKIGLDVVDADTSGEDEQE